MSKRSDGGGTSVVFRPEATGPGGGLTEEDIDRTAELMFDALRLESKRHERDVVPAACPHCGSGDLAPIVYGIPLSIMMRKAAAGEIVLGGPGRKSGDPTVRCRGCGRRSGRVEGHVRGV